MRRCWTAASTYPAIQPWQWGTTKTWPSVHLTLRLDLAHTSGIDASALPPSCPQLNPNQPTASTIESEDCLTATIYAPVGAVNLPVFVWYVVIVMVGLTQRLHGGSFLEGSAAAPGLDGGALAKARMVVVVLQYRCVSCLARGTFI